MGITELERRLFGCPAYVLKRRLSFRRSLERAWSLIEISYSTPDLSLSMISRQCGISKNHLNVLLNTETGLSFHELLSRYRLLQAARMMLSKDYSLLEIALETGFANTTSLARQAKRVLGISPKALRNLLRHTQIQNDTISSFSW